MQLGVEDHVEAQAQTLLTRVRQCEEGARAAEISASAASWLAQFCERTHVEETDSVKFALSRVESTQQTMEDAQDRSEVLRKELHALEPHGLSIAKLDELLSALSDAGHPLTSWTKENVEKLRTKVDKEQVRASKAHQEQCKKADTLHRAVETSLPPTHRGIEGLRSAISQLMERQAEADGLQKKLGSMFDRFPCRGDKALSELVVEAESIRAVAAQFQAARDRESRAGTIFAESCKRRKALEEELAELNPRISSFIRARAVLQSIQKEHSLEGATETALKRNRSDIEAIFGRIHAPAEFSGLGKQLPSLIRKTGGKEVKLSEISSGQRAAFALSIFLAQNAQLKAAPPVVLIDDPIAHVDDLNSLCFLDYLREVVLDGKRQIMFATANAKLAALFERKFDFLGKKEFQRFDLVR